jgi:hypothetical protein
MAQNTIFLVKCYWYDTDREIKVDLHSGLVKIDKRGWVININDVFVFSKQYQQMYYIYTPSFKKDHNTVD